MGQFASNITDIDCAPARAIRSCQHLQHHYYIENISICLFWWDEKLSPRGGQVLKTIASGLVNLSLRRSV